MFFLGATLFSNLSTTNPQTSFCAVLAVYTHTRTKRTKTQTRVSTTTEKESKGALFCSLSVE
jgi:hypothetical protein